jgi:hypothetical protein
MKCPTHYALLAFALGAAYAAPSESIKAGAKFTLSQFENPSYVRSAPHEMAHTHKKHGKVVPTRVVHALSRRASESGAASALPQPYDSQYLVNVSIGTPAQVVPLDIDTGSADLWVVGTLDASVSGQKGYSTSDSSTSKNLQSESWTIQYGDGSTAQGDVYTDVVNMGGISFDTQAVEVSLTEAQSFMNNPNMSGIVGLAFGSLNQVSPDKQKTFFENVKASLAEPVFAVNLLHDRRKCCPGCCS